MNFNNEHYTNRDLVHNAIRNLPLDSKFYARDIYNLMVEKYPNRSMTTVEVSRNIRSCAWCIKFTPRYGLNNAEYIRISPIVCPICQNAMVDMGGYGYRCNHCAKSYKTIKSDNYGGANVKINQ